MIIKKFIIHFIQKGEKFLKSMSAYSANITGCPSYWFKRRADLESTFEQKKTATCFFTFSYADNHWNDLHKLMPGKPAINDAEKRKSVINNPHLVDWYFGYRLKEFLKIVFDDLLEAEWYWYR